jgi:hypothetical protein
MSQLRLVKVHVQPVFVLDDGENISEIEHPAVTIPAAEWGSYSAERFPAEVRAWQDQLDAQEAPSP